MDQKPQPSRKTTLATWIGGIVCGLAAAGLAAWFVFAPAGRPTAPKASPAPLAASSPAPAIATAPARAPRTGFSTPSDLDGWKALIARTEPADLDELAERVRAIPDAGARKAVLDALMTRWLKSDVAGLSDFIFNADDDVVAALVPSLADTLPNVDESLATSPVLGDIVQDFIQIYAERDPNAALSWAKQWLVDQSLDAAYATIAGEVAAKSGPDAARILDLIKDRGSRVEAVANISDALSEHSPEQAMQWALALKDPTEKKAAMENVIATVAEEQPERAAQLLQSLDDPQNASIIGGLVASEWAATDPAKAIAWIQTLPDGDLKSQALEGALLEWSYNEPQKALDFYLQHHSQNPAYAEQIFEAWAYGNPETAVQEAAKLTPQQRARAYAGIVRGWFDHDENSETVAGWVDTLQPGPERDAAARQLVAAVGLDEPEPAWRWAQSIQNESLRREALREAFTSLINNDVAAARTALTEAKLTPNESAELSAILAARERQHPPR